jgi:hypothetical protein
MTPTMAPRMRMVTPIDIPAIAPVEIDIPELLEVLEANGSVPVADVTDDENDTAP